jgi:haloacetate dehalogenase
MSATTKATSSSTPFLGFVQETRVVNGVEIAFRKGGQGEPLLLLHGHPQTHFIWHKVAEQPLWLPI